MQIIDGLTKIYDGTAELMSGVSPFISTMEDDGNQEIASALLNAGYTVEQIQNFVDVSRVQLDEFLTFEVEIAKRIKAKSATKPASKRSVKAA